MTVTDRAAYSDRWGNRCELVTDRAAYSDRSGDRCVMVLHEPITVIAEEIAVWW